MPSCNARGCGNTSGRIKGKSFFKVPDPKKNRESCARWLHNMGNAKWNVNNFVLTSNRVVCSDHFHPLCFERDLKAELCPLFKRRSNLVHGAIPTIFKHGIFDEINIDGTKSLFVRPQKRSLELENTEVNCSSECLQTEN